MGGGADSPSVFRSRRQIYERSVGVEEEVGHTDFLGLKNLPQNNTPVDQDHLGDTQTAHDYVLALNWIGVLHVSRSHFFLAPQLERQRGPQLASRQAASMRRERVGTQRWWS